MTSDNERAIEYVRKWIVTIKESKCLSNENTDVFDKHLAVYETILTALQRDDSVVEEMAECLRRISITRTSNELKEEYGEDYDEFHYDYKAGCDHFVMMARLVFSKFNASRGK